MPVKAKELNDKQVRAIINRAKDGLYPVGRVAGLSLQLKAPNNTSWILRTVINDKRRYIGLGSYPEVSLAQAREDAAELKRRIRREGYDPVSERRERRSEAVKEQAKQVTFAQLATEYIEKRSSEFKTQQQVRKLTNIMDSYALPMLGKLLIKDIDLNLIRKVMTQPTVVRLKDDQGVMREVNSTLWQGKNETANRLRIYLSHIFDAAIASGIYNDLNPARWDGGLKTILPAPQKVSKTEHFAALDVEQMPEFWAKLQQQDWTAAKVLQFGILTATRNSEMREPKWSEIDFTNKVWRIPAERMKGENPRAHNIPLPDAALAVLESMPRECEYIFPNTKGKPLTDAAISKVPKRIGYDVTAHGFRSTFKDWARQPAKYGHEQYADELSELALAHVNNDATRAAYARDELLEERRPMMQAWAEYCQQRLDNVVKFGGKKHG